MIKNFEFWLCTHTPMTKLLDHKEELFSDKEKAMKFMLTEETSQVNEMREELSFYTNQCLEEAKRIAKDNAVIFSDHFTTQAQLQCTYINQFHSVWADFMKHFAVDHVKDAKSVLGGLVVRKADVAPEPIYPSAEEIKKRQEAEEAKQKHEAELYS